MDDPVLSFFPDDAPLTVSANLAAMRVRHLLTMTTGHDKDATDATFRRRDHRAERAFFSVPVPHAPGTHFVYNSAASYMLSAIVQKLTGQTCGRRTSHASASSAWTGGSGTDNESSPSRGSRRPPRGRSPTGTLPLPTGSRATGTSSGAASRGASTGATARVGQYCIVMPEQDAVMAINAGVSDMQAVLSRTWEKLLPGIDAAPSASSPPSADLARRLGSLRLDPPPGAPTSPKARLVSGRVYALSPNALKLASFRFDFGEASSTMTTRQGRARSVLELGHGEWREGILLLPAGHTKAWHHAPVCASGAWTTGDTFVVTTREIQTPFVHTLTSRFSGSQLLCDREVNVSFGPVKGPRVKGIAAR